MSETLSPIRPESIAAKLAAVREIKFPQLTGQFQTTPRLAELLWFLQHISRQPGGLAAFVQNFIAQNAARFGTKTMRTLAGKKTPWTAQDCDTISREIPRYHGNSWFLQCFERARFPADTKAKLLARQAAMARAAMDGEDYVPESPTPDPARKPSRNIDREYFTQGFRQVAAENLPLLIASFCMTLESRLPAPWWFPDLIPALFEAMDAHAAAAAKKIVMTAVALKVFDALDYAVKTRSFVHIQGESRFGKTQAIKTWCEMHPGKVRLVNTPSSNSDADLFRAVAEALGVEFSFNTPAREIKSRLEYIIRHGGLALVFDEAHFLLPQRYSADTAPSRLNFLRTEIIDRRSPVALVSTPQSYRQHLSKFVKKTGYNMEQFIGRKMLDIILPDSLEQDDLLAVAKFHFPALDPDDLELIVAKAMQSEQYLLAVEAVAQRAQWIAERDGHTAVKFEDVELAIAEVIPTAATTPSTPPARPAPAQPIATRRPRPIRPARPAPSEPAIGDCPSAMSAPPRSTSPVTLNTI